MGHNFNAQFSILRAMCTLGLFICCEEPTAFMLNSFLKSVLIKHVSPHAAKLGINFFKVGKTVMLHLFKGPVLRTHY